MKAGRLQSFIRQNIGAILSEWDLFAKTKIPAAATMSLLELRDHAEEVLLAIADDIGCPQTEAQRDQKSKGLADGTADRLAGARHTARFVTCPASI